VEVGAAVEVGPEVVVGPGVFIGVEVGPEVLVGPGVSVGVALGVFGLRRSFSRRLSFVSCIRAFLWVCLGKGRCGTRIDLGLRRIFYVCHYSDRIHRWADERYFDDCCGCCFRQTARH